LPAIPSGGADPNTSHTQPAAIIDEFMTAWEQEKTSDDYKKTVQVSERATAERKELKKRAHAALQNLVRGNKINQ